MFTEVPLFIYFCPAVHILLTIAHVGGYTNNIMFQDVQLASARQATIFLAWDFVC